MIEFASPWALLALLSLPAIVALHSLRPTRRRVTLASNMLWREALRERHRGLGLERLLRNLSLLLLLLFALLVSLALGDPRWLTRGTDRGDVVVVIDTSASMQVGDRFEQARREAEALIDALPGGGRLLLMSSGRNPVLRSAFESDKRLLRERLAALEASDEAGLPRAALTLALSLLRNRERGRVYFLTDGAFYQGLDFAAVDIEHRRVGEAANNVAVSRFDLRPEPDSEDRFEVLVTVVSHADTTLTVPVTVSLDRQTLVEQDLSLAPGSRQTLVWPFRGSSSGRAEVVLGIDDALEVDNHAYAVLGGEETLRVLLLSTGSLYLESALAALPNVIVTRLDSVPVEYLEHEVRRHDVVVLDRLAAPELPPGSYLLVDSIPPGLPFSAKGVVERPALAGRGASALLEQVDLTALRIDRATRIAVDDSRPDLQRLFWSEQTVLALAGIDAARRFVYLGFDPSLSSLPLQAAFPLFIRQSVEWLRPRGRRGVSSQVAAGDPFEIALPVDLDEVIVRDPDNQAAVYHGDGGRLVFDRTSRTGIYQYTLGYDSAAVQRYFAVNLTDEHESDVSPRAIRPDPSSTSTERTAEGRVTRELWPYLALLALLALLVEWCLPIGRRPHA